MSSSSSSASSSGSDDDESLSDDDSPELEALATQAATLAAVDAASWLVDNAAARLAAEAARRARRRAAAVFLWRLAAAVACAVAAPVAAEAFRRERGAWSAACATGVRPDGHACDRYGRGAEPFACPGAVVAPFSVAPSRVGDGVRDCCDGSDEGAADLAACAAAGRRRAGELEVLVAESAAAGRARAKLAARAAAAAAAAATDARRLGIQLAQLQQRAQQATSYHEAMQLQQYLAGGQAEYGRLAEAAAASADAYGADGAWLGLRGTCVDSPPFSEKQTLGGTSNVLPRTYVFRVCPFDNVTQNEPSHGSWRRKTDEEEGIAKKKKKKKTILDLVDDDEPEPIGLGHFNTWARPATASDLAARAPASDEPFAWPATFEDAAARVAAAYAAFDLDETVDRALVALEALGAAAARRAAGPAPAERAFYGANRVAWVAAAADDDGAAMIFDRGAPCGSRRRVVVVAPVCGVATAVTRVDEDGTCAYRVVLATPAACGSDAAPRLRARRVLLSALLDHPRTLAAWRRVSSLAAAGWRALWLALV